MNVPGIWDEAWSRIDQTFKDLAAQMGKRVTNLTQNSGRTKNEVFPFRAYASFKSANKVIDPSIDCRCEKDHWILWVDIAWENGKLLADFPPIYFSDLTDEIKLKTDMLEAIKEIQSFFEHNIDMVCQELTESNSEI